VPACCQTREYFIAAEEVVWDYAPFNGEMCGGSLVNFSDNAKTFVEAGPDRIGRKYIKALYVEYTDATFTQKKVSELNQSALCCQSAIATSGFVSADGAAQGPCSAGMEALNSLPYQAG
jgi:hypothetical protein